MESVKPGFFRRSFEIAFACVLLFFVVIVPIVCSAILLHGAGEYLAIHWRYGHAAWLQGLRFAHDARHFTNGDVLPPWLGELVNGFAMAFTLPVIVCSLFAGPLLVGRVLRWGGKDSSNKKDGFLPRPAKIPGPDWRRIFSIVEMFVIFAIFYGIALCLTRKYNVGEHPWIMTTYGILYAFLTPMLWLYLTAVCFLLLGGPFLFRWISFHGMKAWLIGVIGFAYFIGLLFGWWLR